MANDININESAILETLNAKIDYDGGNYKGSGLANYVVDKSGDTMTGQLNFDLDASGIRPLQIKANDKDISAPPTEGIIYNYFDFCDKNNVRLGVIGVQLRSNGRYGAYLQAGNQASLAVTTDGTNAFCEFPRCTTKATTTSSAANDKVAVIVKNYCNGTSWYRVWSDGWKEQGGFFASAANNTSHTVTLLQSFSNTNYSVLTTSSVSNHWATIESKATGSCVIRYSDYGNTAAGAFYWHACGY